MARVIDPYGFCTKEGASGQVLPDVHKQPVTALAA